MQEAPRPADVLNPLSDGQFTALRLWAMSFGAYRPAGVAAWPFRYASEQRDRLYALVDAIPRNMRLTWVVITGVAWFVVGFSIGFLLLIPLIAAKLSPHLTIAAKGLLMAGIFADLSSAFVLGNVIATWIGGRILAVFTTLPALDQANGDAKLLADIRRRIAWVVLVGAVSAAAPLMLRLFVL